MQKHNCVAKQMYTHKHELFISLRRQTNKKIKALFIL
jgi:hypothetical protein